MPEMIINGRWLDVMSGSKTVPIDVREFLQDIIQKSDGYGRVDLKIEY